LLALDPIRKFGVNAGEADMDTGLLITVYLVSAFVAGLAATMVARAKYRHAGYWMLACFLFPPLILLLLLLPKGRNVQDPRRDPFDGKGDDEDDDDTRTVPIEPLI
jgi:hypothetical protein